MVYSPCSSFLLLRLLFFLSFCPLLFFPSFLLFHPSFSPLILKLQLLPSLPIYPPLLPPIFPPVYTSSRPIFPSNLPRPIFFPPFFKFSNIQTGLSISTHKTDVKAGGGGGGGGERARQRVIKLSGSDAVGILSKISEYFEKNGINVEDMTTESGMRVCFILFLFISIYFYYICFLFYLYFYFYLIFCFRFGALLSNTHIPNDHDGQRPCSVQCRQARQWYPMSK